MHHLRVLATLLLGLLLVAGCSSEPVTEAQDPTVETPTTDDPSDDADRPRDSGTKSETVEVPETLTFTGTTVGGEPFDGASLAGRPTLLWFWAPWCPTCRSQIPQVEGLASQYGDQLNVVGVGSLDSAEAIAGFADDVDGVTHLEDTEGELWKRFGVTEQSSFVLLDADGAVAYEAGYGGSGELDAQVDAVLG